MRSVQKEMRKVLFTKATASTATLNSGSLAFPTDQDGGVFILEHGTGTGTTPTLDVAIQVSYDDGTTFLTAWRFAQVTTTAGTRRIVTSFRRVAEVGAESAVTDTGGALATNHPISNKIRILFTIGGTSPSYATLKVSFIGARSALGVSY